jgi:DNA invertase Pin-like site-specific DNA recombinase
MKVLGYTRVSSDKQDLQKQEHLLLKYAQQDLRVEDFIKGGGCLRPKELSVTSRRKERL